MKTLLHDMDVRLEGEAKARDEDIKIFVDSCREFGISDEDIKLKLQEKYSLSEIEITSYIERG